MSKLACWITLILSLCMHWVAAAQPSQPPQASATHKNEQLIAQLIKQLSQRWDETQIPSASLSIVVGDQVRSLRLGQAQTGAFELASCSKAVTGLLLALLENEGYLRRDDPVTRYLPELAHQPKNGWNKVKISHLLAHTSGLPEHTLDLLRPDSGAHALGRLPALLKDVVLTQAAGSKEEYATLNYSLLGLIAERVTGKPYANLLREKIFLPLGMQNTFVDGDPASPNRARAPGHKIGFEQARAWNAPRYLQNTPAGYVLSTPQDMALWLQFWLRSTSSDTSDRNNTGNTALHALLAARANARQTQAAAGAPGYALGWEVDVGKTSAFTHPGQNPDAGAWVGFDPQAQVGVALLGNSNSPQVIQLGRAAFEFLRDPAKHPLPAKLNPDSGDRWSGIIAALSGLLCLALWPLWSLCRSKSRAQPAEAGSELLSRVEASIVRESLAQSAQAETWAQLARRLLTHNLVLGLALAGVPKLALGLSWPSLLIWGPVSLPWAAAGLVLLANGLSLFFFAAIRHGAQFGSRTFSLIMVTRGLALTVVSGLLNSGLILCILQAIEGSQTDLLGSAALLLACVYFYIGYRKAAEQQIMHFGHAFVQGWRMEIIRRLLGADYRSLEQLSPGKIQSVVGEDSQELARSVLSFVPFLTNFLTIIFLFAYLMIFKSTAATALLLACAVPMIVLYHVVSERADRIMPQALQTRSDFMDTVEDLQKGYKGLRRAVVQRHFYGHALAVSERFKQLRIRYDHGFLAAFFVGESMLTVLLVAIALVFPALIIGFDGNTAREYLIILLYMIGPLNVVMGGVPELVRLQSLRRSMAHFSQSIQPAGLVPNLPAPAAPNQAAAQQASPNPAGAGKVKRLELAGVGFHYPSSGDGEAFGIGPMSLIAEPGKTYFLTGGNGSGKSTLAMILAGLYSPQQGCVLIDGKAVSATALQELTRTIFSDNWLLRRVYDPALLQARASINQHIATLGLSNKTTLQDDGAFTSIRLSTGQRKRLALAMLLADPCPLVILDEWAADQDPHAKATFYREWLPVLKAQGRIVFVVTHDDEYFDQADVLITMKNGQIINSPREIHV
jgi:multidrug/microcin transport system ATP-binding/permease protein